MANIVIVGANQGIGYYLVKRLLELNNSVAVLDIEISTITKLQQKYPNNIMPIIADAQNLESIQKGIDQAVERFKSIDIAIHNACYCTFENEQNSNYDVYQKTMDINFYGALRLAKTVLPYMRKAKKGELFVKVETVTKSQSMEVVDETKKSYACSD